MPSTQTTMKLASLLTGRLRPLILAAGLGLACLNTSSNLVAAETNSAAASAMSGAQPGPLDKLDSDQLMDVTVASRGMMTGVVVSLGFFAMIIACVGFAVRLRVKRQQQLHETIRLMIEKGQPIPPELLNPSGNRPPPSRDLRSGLVLVGVGLGLAVLLFVKHSEVWPVALIPLFMGIALLIAWKIQSKKSEAPK